MFKIIRFNFSRGAALITILSLILALAGVVPLAQANPSLTSVKDTISDSDLSVVANHAFSFTSTVAVDGSTDTITITFPSGFSIPDALDYTDVDLADDGVDKTLAASAAAGVWGVGVATTTRIITFTAPTDAGATEIAVGSVITVEVGTNATTGVTGDQQITNPASAASYSISIGGTWGDTGTAIVAIIDDVVVTATVTAAFVFTVSAVASSQTVNGATTGITSTATTIPFGTLSAGTSVIGAQDLAVTTNANDGFIVTIEQDQNLTSDAGADIDCFKDATCATTPVAWTVPVGTLGTEGTYGHFGITSEDSSLETNCASDTFGANLWAGLSGTTFDQVMCHTGSADGSTAHIGATRVGFQAEITALQEAGDYTNSLTYIATPTF